MTRDKFIEEIAALIQAIAPAFGIKVCSPIIAQACLESAYGTSELAINAHNYFGLKYRADRTPSACGMYKKVGSEQGKDGKYTSSMMTWAKFSSMKAGVRGYFEFTNVKNYENLKGVTDPEEYLKRIKADGYATSLKYVENLMRVIKDNDLTWFDQKEGNEMVKIKELLAHASNHGGARSKISYIVLHYTANDGDTDTANAKYFQGKNRKASAHYFVDDDSITRSVKDDVIAWSVGGNKYPDCSKTGGGKFYGKCTNSNSISVEMCDTKKDGKHNLSAKTRENAANLVAYLIKKYNIDINHVIRHFDVTGKKCPAYWATKDNADWKKFKAEVMTKLKKDTPTKSAAEKTEVSSEKAESSTKKVESSAKVEVYKKYTGKSAKIDEVFKSVGVPEKYRGSASKRKPIAEKNGIKNYKGSAEQNLRLISLAKNGKLKKA